MSEKMDGRGQGSDLYNGRNLFVKHTPWLGYVGPNEVMDNSNIIISDSGLFRFWPPSSCN